MDTAPLRFSRCNGLSLFCKRQAVFAIIMWHVIILWGLRGKQRSYFHQTSKKKLLISSICSMSVGSRIAGILAAFVEDNPSTMYITCARPNMRPDGNQTFLQLGSFCIFESKAPLRHARSSIAYHARTYEIMIGNSWTMGYFEGFITLRRGVSKGARSNRREKKV